MESVEPVSALAVADDLFAGLEEAFRNRYQPRRPVSLGIAIQIFERGIESLSPKQLDVFNRRILPAIKDDCRLLCGCLPGMADGPQPDCRLCRYLAQNRRDDEDEGP